MAKRWHDRLCPRFPNAWSYVPKLRWDVVFNVDWRQRSADNHTSVILTYPTSFYYKLVPRCKMPWFIRTVNVDITTFINFSPSLSVNKRVWDRHSCFVPDSLVFNDKDQSDPCGRRYSNEHFLVRSGQWSLSSAQKRDNHGLADACWRFRQYHRGR